VPTKSTGGVEKAYSSRYVVVALDVMLPGISGLDIVKQLRQKSSVPVLMLTEGKSSCILNLGA